MTEALHSHDLTVSSSIAHKLAEAGYPQAQSAFVWVRYLDGDFFVRREDKHRPSWRTAGVAYDAPTSDELIEWLRAQYPVFGITISITPQRVVATLEGLGTLAHTHSVADTLGLLIMQLLQEGRP